MRILNPWLRYHRGLLDGAAKAPVEKANLEDTVSQAHGRRLRALDSRDPLSQQVVALGVVSGNAVEN